MPPAIIDAMTRFRAEVQRGETAAVNEMARRWLSVERALQSEVEASVRELLAYRASGGLVNRAALLRNRRFLSLLAQTREQVRRFVPEAERVIADRQRTVVRLGVEHATEAIQTVAARAQFNRLPASAVENMVGLAGDGSPLRDLLNESYGAGAEGILDEMVRGVALGRGPVAIARRIVRQGLSRSLDRMILVNRTETLRAYRQASLDTYRKSGVVRGYYRVASHSARTCIGCLAVDGEFFELDVPFDEHPAGRCSMRPAVIGAPELKVESGADWFARQDEKTQRAMLGPAKFELYKAGTPFDAFATRRENATWGGAFVPANWAQVGQGGGIGGTVAKVVSPPSVSAMPQWKPSMTYAEAEQWAATSVIKDTQYHMTPARNVTSLNSQGFDVGRSKFGKVWGEGVYMTSDPDAVDYYRAKIQRTADFTFDPQDIPARVSVKINVRNPYIFDAGKFSDEFVSEQFNPQWIIGKQIDESRFRELVSELGSERALSTLMQEKGYDAIQIVDSRFRAPVGGSQIVVFNPKQVVIIDE